MPFLPLTHYCLVVLDIQVTKTLFGNLVNATSAARQTVGLAGFATDHNILALVS